MNATIVLFGLTGLVERIQQSPNLGIELLHLRVIAGAALPDIILGHLAPAFCLPAMQPRFAFEVITEARGTGIDLGS